MLYLAGDDDVLDQPTRELYDTLQQMPYNPEMRLVVLYDVNDDIPTNGYGDSRIYVRDPGGLTDVTPKLLVPGSPWPGFPANSELRTGRSTTLREFLRWSRATYPISQTMLAIVDHGGGWAPHFDDADPQPRGRTMAKAGGLRGAAIDATDGYASLSTRAISEALRDGLNGQSLDVIFFDACLMGMLETAYQIRDYADYMVAAENLLFAEYPYDDYLSRARLKGDTLPRDLAISIVNRYNAQLSGSHNPFSIAAVDLRQLRGAAPSSLVPQVNKLAQQILAGLPPAPVTLSHPLRAALKRAYDSAQKFDYDSSLAIDPTDGYVDLADFAHRLRDSADSAISPAVKATAAELFTTITSQVVIHKRTVSGIYEPELGRRQRWNFAGAYGLSIFLPLGEQDWRPTDLNSAGSDAPACSERQLGYYVLSDQLAFAAGAPGWSQLLLRLEANTPIRAPNLCPNQLSVSSTLLTAEQIDRRPFHNPAPVQPVWMMFLPLVRR
jgi:hypothetical protein